MFLCELLYGISRLVGLEIWAWQYGKLVVLKTEFSGAKSSKWYDFSVPRRLSRGIHAVNRRLWFTDSKATQAGGRRNGE